MVKLYWHQYHSRGQRWNATTAPTTDEQRRKLECMGYATRIASASEPPFGEPTQEERKRVNEACKSQIYRS